MTTHVEPLTCDGCGQQSSSTANVTDEPHKDCPANPPGRWVYGYEDGAELAGPAYDDDDAGGLPSPHAWAPDDAEELAEHMPPDVFESGTWRLLQQEQQHGQVLSAMTCTGCGCTDAKPCPGGCIWASEHPPRCSRCELMGGAAHG
jgi:hypothetical protein